jgi:uroporphyrinogen decarboxylase
LWPSPSVEASRADDLAELNLRYPSDIIAPEFKYPPGKKSQGKPYREGEYTDAWGCTWRVVQDGTAGEIKVSPLSDLGELADYKPPLELLDAGRFAKVNRGCETTSRFVLARTEVRPFERLSALHGMEATLADLAHDARPIRGLLAILHDYYCREIEMWAGTEVDGVAIRDDWGALDSLRVPPAMWREVFRPLYREYCKILRAKDKFVFFQSDGNISDIFSDLVQIGVDAIHAQWGAMNLERLAKRFRGQVTFWGGLDEPRLLQGGSLEEIRQSAQRVRKILDYSNGGVIAQCPWESGASIRSLVAVFEQWLLPLPMHA